MAVLACTRATSGYATLNGCGAFAIAIKIVHNCGVTYHGIVVNVLHQETLTEHGDGNAASVHEGEDEA